MILDASAVVAIVLREPGWEVLVDAVANEPPCGIGAPTVVESGIVLTAKLGPSADGMLAHLLQLAGATIIPFTDDHWRVAVEAYTRFGKGRHAAGLNFGDCLSYAVARLAEQPLLFVGDDFRKTDLVAAR
ncbi:MAG: type II toxin-antitoxin system VapC family toxin [Candidatus Binatia bacterium]